MQPAYDLRHMHVSDLPAINRILSKAFTSARIAEGLKKTHIPLCHLSFLEMYLANFPSGCYVLEEKNRLIGYSFAHLWGEVGWIGPVAILPAHHGKSLGKEVVGASVATLQQTGAKVIGLETTPRNYGNLGFYSKLGFLPERLTLDLVRPVKPIAKTQLPSGFGARFYSAIENDQRADPFSKINKLANRIDPFLHIENEIELIHKFNYGDTLLVHYQNSVIACVMGHTEPYSPQESGRHLKITLMLVSPAYVEYLNHVLSLINEWAVQKKLDVINIRTPTRYCHAYKKLLSEGFRVFHSELRWTLEGFHEVADVHGFYLSKWE